MKLLVLFFLFCSSSASGQSIDTVKTDPLSLEQRNYRIVKKPFGGEYTKRKRTARQLIKYDAKNKAPE